MPYILMLLFLILSSKLVAPVNAFLAQFTSKVVLYSGEGGATVSLAWIGNGGVMIFLAGAIGKLISPQSIAVAIAAIGLDGADGKIMSQTVKYCIAFGVIVCAFSYITAVLI